MSELIPIQDNEGVQAVMGRDLHAFLEVGAEYRHWFPRMVAYGFEEGKDYTVKNDRVQDSLGREREAINHIVSLDMAKEISMIQRTDKGKQARQYFIECEKKARAQAPAIPQTYAEALRAAAEQYERAEAAALEAKRSAKRLELAAPKIAKADAHSEVKEWKRRQDFYREVQQYGDTHGLDIKQGAVRDLLTRKGMLIAAGRSDSGQITRQAARSGWGRNYKGVAENGHAFTTPQLSPKGQDIAWKWIVKAIDEFGAELNPRKVA
ncbi:antA/AntB antirepressor family protein [Corynebacterium sp. 5QC2CO]|uniref:antA/AntB antirepressor family protein n=1 Tax=Corynebacterium sp. 5QC2CO TaxID=2968468 RepID=UPI00211CD447|nr:antA/AntB antirepressor family protein [Corynebacterium sp. 5QC2CO]MCQ9349357.1 antA/AntB antirepressor family protein [Corynebacterium sp. 5QC2CO]